MCTVTFIPTKSGIVITSNRDESINRAKAIVPIKMESNGFEVLFPKDPDAGGTWIATKNNGDTIVLLNGSFEKHVSNPPYAKSRGLILLAIFELTDFKSSIGQFNLDNIEPFTIIYYTNDHLFEFSWDGNIRYLKELNIDESYIWSSSTLYDIAIRNKRKKWFNQWSIEYPLPSQDDIIDFHLNAGEGDSSVDIKMNRDNKLFTVSISSIFISNNHIDFIYLDIDNDQTTKERIDLIKKFESIL